MLDDLIKESQSSLSKIQNLFDQYQNTYFESRSPEFFCLELNGEAGELANNEKKQWKGRQIEHVAFEDEAADVLIALMNYSNARKVDLANAVARKLQTIENKRIELLKEGKNF